MSWRAGILGWRPLAAAAIALVAPASASPLASTSPATPATSTPATSTSASPASPAVPTAPTTPTTPATPSLTVDEIVARHLAARGGLKRIKSVETLRQTGQVTAGPGRQARVTRELKRSGRIRFEFTVQGVTAVYLYDGQKGWQVSPFDGVLAPEPLPDEAVTEALEQADLDGPLVDWRGKGHQLELAGRATVGDRETYKLKLTLGSGAVQHHYIDVKSYSLVRTDTTRHVRGRAVQIETTFDGHKKTKGLLFPRRIESRAAGRPNRLQIVVDQIEVNPALSDARFQLAVPVTDGP